MDITTDFHQQGVFAVKNPNGQVLFDTFASTAYSARAEFGRRYNKKWHAAEKQGYSMFGYAETTQVVSTPREGDVEERTVDEDALDIPRTAGDWDLYSGKPGAEEAAQAMGAKLEELVTAARRADNCTYNEAARIRDLMYVEMDKYENLGARDTEPETVLVARIAAALNLDERLSR